MFNEGKLTNRAASTYGFVPVIGSDDPSRPYARLGLVPAIWAYNALSKRGLVELGVTHNRSSQ